MANGRTLQIPCVVIGNGRLTKLGRLQTVEGANPTTPLTIPSDLFLNAYDQGNFGLMRTLIPGKTIVGTYLSAPYVAGRSTAGTERDTFRIDTESFAVAWLWNLFERPHGSELGISVVPQLGRADR